MRKRGTIVPSGAIPGQRVACRQGERVHFVADPQTVTLCGLAWDRVITEATEAFADPTHQPYGQVTCSNCSTTLDVLEAGLRYREQVDA